MASPFGALASTFAARGAPRGSTTCGATLLALSPPLPDYTHDQRLTENQVRSLCSQLGIPVEDFGLSEEAP